MRILSLCVMAAAAIMFGCTQAETQPQPNPQSSLEGTWKLSKPLKLLVPADGTPVPFTPAGKELYERNKAAAAKGDYSFDETIERCSSPGMPRIMLSPKRFKVLEIPGKITFIFEWNRLFRQIDTRDDATIQNSKPLPGSADGFPDRFEEQQIVGSQMGSARGHWEGDTLVVETDHFVDYKLLDGLILTSDELSLSERFRLKNNNTLEHRITISDPVTFTRPWDVVLNYDRQDDVGFAEDVCMERQKQGETIWPKL